MGQRPGHCKRLMEGAKLLMADFEDNSRSNGILEGQKTCTCEGRGGQGGLGNVDFDMPFSFLVKFLW